MKNYLEESGCKVFEADSADKAITTILLNANAENKIELAIINYYMPVMNAYQLVYVLRQIPTAKDLKLILLCSIEHKMDWQSAREFGFTGYLTKPIKRDELINCIAAALGVKNADVDEEENKIANSYIMKEQNDLESNILLVEDNQMNRKLIITLLKNLNLKCDIATNGSEAVKAVLKKDYDIVFMDCQMPVMDGYESTAKIREIEGDRKHTIIVAMTAHAMESDRKKCLDSGMDEYLTKPLNFDELIKIIEKYSSKGK